MFAPSSDLAEPPTLAHAVPDHPPPLDFHFSWRRLAVIAGILVFLLIVNGFVCFTASYFFDLSGWLVWQILPGLCPICFMTTTLLGFRHAHPVLRMVYVFSAVGVGALNFAFFAAGACWLLAGISWATRGPFPRLDIALLCFGVALATTVYGLINAAWIRVSEVTVDLPHLPEAWKGRTLALVTDLHLGHISGPGFLRRIIARFRTLKPDVVLISGDMFDGTPLGLDRLVAPWEGYSAPRGIYYVTGNHDEFADRNIYINAVTATGLRALNNEKVTIDDLQIVGVHDSEASDPGELRSILRRARIDASTPSILLAHKPINLVVAETEGISLQLSGHTHRGQLWPWNKLVSRIFGPFAYGLHSFGKLLVYTSSGVGTWGPPFRVGTKSEIVLIRLNNLPEN